MRKSICILSAVLLILLCACSITKDSFKDPVHFYYPELPGENGAVENTMGYEVLEKETLPDNLPDLLERYLRGPQSQNLYSPFPADLGLINATVAQNTVYLTFNSQFAQLSGIERTLACACISMTCLEWTGAESVEISAEGTRFNGEEKIVLAMDDLLFTDNTPLTEPNS